MIIYYTNNLGNLSINYFNDHHNILLHICIMIKNIIFNDLDCIQCINHNNVNNLY